MVKAVQNTIAHHQPLDVEYRVIHPDGHVNWLKSKGTVVYKDDFWVALLVGTCIDITQQKQTEQKLMQLQGHVEKLVAERIIDLKENIDKLQQEVGKHQQVEESLLINQDQLRYLATELTLVEARERLQLAYWLHDQLSQNLALISIHLNSYLGSLTGSAENHSGIEEAIRLIMESIQAIRDKIFDLNPPALFDLELSESILWLLEEFSQRYGIEKGFHDDQIPKPISQDVRIIVLQAIRELLINVVKHAHASKVTITLERQDDDVSIEIKDDGKGFDTSLLSMHATRNHGFGLFSFRERLHAMRCRLEIKSEPGIGTIVRIIAPLANSES